MIKRLLLLIALIGIATPAHAALTTVCDVLKLANNTLYNGTIDLSWPTFTAGDGTVVPRGHFQTKVINGVLNVALQPTDTATPAGTYYQALYSLNLGLPNPEIWLVPTSTPCVKLATIRTVSPPATSFNVSLAQIATTGPGVLFGANNAVAQDNTNLFWDNTGKTLTVANILGLNLAGSGVRCVQADASGNLSAASTACGGFGAVSSVFGRIGAVTAQSGDYTASQISGIGYQLVGNNGASQTVRNRLNFIPSANVSYGFTDNAGTNSTDITINATGGGGGSGNPSSLTCSTSILTTVLTAETAAGSTTPCIYGINDQTYTFTSSPTVTITGAPTGNGTYCVYIDPTGAETMQISSGAGGTFVGSSVTVLAVSSPCGSSPPFPAGSYEKATGTITASSTSWTTVADARPTAGNKASLTAGNGIATISNGQIATDTTVMQKGAVNAITGTINLTAGTQIESNSSSLPGTCVVGQTYFLTGTTAGQNWYGCTATNTWTLQSGGSVDPTLIQYTSVHLTSSQIKNLTTVPITLIAAPGANKYIELVSVSVVYLYGTTTYTAGATTFIGYGNGTSVIGGLASGFATTTFTGGVSQVSFQAANQPQADSVTSIVNQPITTANFTTDFATGDGTAYVHLSYRVVPTNN